MTNSHHLVGYSKAQMKIQQMAFMLIAIMIFFSMVGLIYFAITLSNLETKAQALGDEEAMRTVRKISSTPELAFTVDSSCSSCVDLDKAFVLKTYSGYKELWNLDYLMIEIISPQPILAECTTFNYPDCNTITIVDNSQNTIATKTAFIALARFDQSKNTVVYELGKIHASAKQVD